MRTLMIFIVAGALFLSGCAQMEGVTGELHTCLEKCQDICDLVKDSNISLGGYNTIKLTKQEGPVTTYCSCQCSS